MKIVVETADGQKTYEQASHREIVADGELMKITHHPDAPPGVSNPRQYGREVVEVPMSRVIEVQRATGPEAHY